MQALSDAPDMLGNRAFSHDVSTAAVLVLQNNNGGHIGIPNKSCGSWTLFLCKKLFLFQYIFINDGYVSENPQQDSFSLLGFISGTEAEK